MSQEKCEDSSLVEDVCRAGPKTRVVVNRLAFLRAGSKVEVIKPEGLIKQLTTLLSKGLLQFIMPSAMMREPNLLS